MIFDAEMVGRIFGVDPRLLPTAAEMRRMRILRYWSRLDGAYEMRRLVVRFSA